MFHILVSNTFLLYHVVLISHCVSLLQMMIVFLLSATELFWFFFRCHLTGALILYD